MSAAVVPAASGRMAAAIAEIWARSRPAALERVDVLEGATLALLEDTLDEELRRSAEREAHKLSGSLGTFGFAEGSRLARALEQAFGALDALGPMAVPELSEQVLALRREIEQPLPEPEPAAAPSGDSNRLLIISAEAARADSLVAEAARRQLGAAVAASAAEAERVLATAPVQAAVLDLSGMPAEQGLALLDELSTLTPPVPTLVLAEEDALDIRLEIVRRGGRGPLPTTTAAAEVLDGIVRILAREQPLAATVLVVDDDPTILALARATLEPRGFTVATLEDPLHFWTILESTAPELLILDLDMPSATGLELCRLVRNDPRWADVPVLFLTARHDPEVVHEIFACGADDFIRKPLVGPELTNRAVNRVECTRLLRSQAETDPLTGIANRLKGEREIDRYLRLARRHEHPLCLAVLDLDHFKQVNDQHGHTSGDAVLRRFAQLLERSFRMEDVVARWGGEEFVVGMYAANAVDGARRFRELLSAFREERFTGADGRSFGVTLSAGMAVFPHDAADATQLYEVADRALFAAKSGGRNRVIVAGGESVGDESASSSSTMDVVLVEDDEALASLLLHSLRTHGHRTHWLRNGDEALQSLGGARPELTARVLLLDVDLPGLDGLSVLRHLARDGVLHGTRAIMLTARATETEIVRAFELGAFDHVAKPFSVPVLMQRILRAQRR